MRPDLNTRLRVWRLSYGSDDAYGGAAEVHTNIGDYMGRFEMSAPSKMLIEQGIEIDRPASILLRVGQGCGQTTKSLQEGDQIEVTGPTHHPYINTRWGVRSVQYSGNHPVYRGNLISVIAMRVDQSRTEADQD